MSAPSLPVLLKMAGLIAFSGISGVYMGWSAVGQIDPFYYMPRTHGGRYVPDHAEYSGGYDQPAHAQPYYVDYPYAPAPVAMEPAMPADPMPDAIDDVSAYSNLQMVSVPDTEPGGCIDCGGPYEPVEATAEPTPVKEEIMTEAPATEDASVLDRSEVY
jgi:hypothetical protein